MAFGQAPGEAPKLPEQTSPELKPKTKEDLAHLSLQVETQNELPKKLDEAVLNADKKYNPRYWFLADIITSYVKEVKSSPSLEALTNIARLNSVFDYFLNHAKDLKFLEALLAQLDIPEPEKKGVLKTQTAPSIALLMSQGESDPSKLALLAIYRLIEKSNLNPTTSPEERTFNSLFFQKMTVPVFLAHFAAAAPNVITLV